MSEMNRNRFFTLPITAALVLTVAVLSACGSAPTSFAGREASAQSKQTAPQTPNAATQDFEFLRSLGDVCLYKNLDYLNKPEGKRLYELMKAGYPKEISLEEGVAIFNKFAECNETGKTQPPLRAEEVVASIRDWVCEDDRDVKDKKSCGEFWKIAETGRVPKGAFLDSTSGRIAYKGYDVDSWHTELFIRLDKNRRDTKGAPYFRRTVRLNYISSRPTKGV